MDMSDLKQFEAIDTSQYEGQKTKIANVEQVEVPSQFNKRGKQWVLRVESENIIEGIRASELFNLREDENGIPLGWANTSNLGKFLIKMKVKRPEELVGLTVTMRARDNFLGFVL